MGIEEIRERLRQEKIAQVARETGLHANTVRLVRNGGNPTLQTLRKIQDYLVQHG